ISCRATTSGRHATRCSRATATASETSKPTATSVTRAAPPPMTVCSARQHPNSRCCAAMFIKSKRSKRCPNAHRRSEKRGLAPIEANAWILCKFLRIWWETMIGRLTLMLAALLLGTSPALTQWGASNTGTVIPDECRLLTQEKLADLKKRKAKLEAEVTRRLALAVGQRSSAAKHDPQVMPDSTDDLRRYQEELLQLVFQIDCLERGKKLPPIASRSRGVAREPGGPAARSSGESASGPADVYEVPIYYATNRNRTGDELPTKLYGSDFAQDFTHHYGRVVVTIPRTHVAGNIE